jgi:hypothetical protein
MPQDIVGLTRTSGSHHGVRKVEGAQLLGRTNQTLLGLCRDEVAKNSGEIRLVIFPLPFNAVFRKDNIVTGLFPYNLLKFRWGTVRSGPLRLHA